MAVILTEVAGAVAFVWLYFRDGSLPVEARA
jgi:hypothetical protein